MADKQPLVCNCSPGLGPHSEECPVRWPYKAPLPGEEEGHPSYTNYTTYCSAMRAAGYKPTSYALWGQTGMPLGPEPTRELRDKTSAERKGEPVYSGVMLYFPDAIAAVARISVAGNNKHNPGEPLHWARGKSMDQMDALARHSLTPEKLDPETGEVEAAAMVWRGLAQLQLIEEKRLKAAGIMPYSGIVP